jgi:hypothetical protein
MATRYGSNLSSRQYASVGIVESEYPDSES